MGLYIYFIKKSLISEHLKKLQNINMSYNVFVFKYVLFGNGPQVQKNHSEINYLHPSTSTIVIGEPILSIYRIHF